MGKINQSKNHKAGSQKSGKSLQGLSDAYRQLAPYLNIGYVWAVAVILFTLLGWYLDNHWQTSPWLTLAGAILGIIVGFYNFFKTVSDQRGDKKNSQ